MICRVKRNTGKQTEHDIKTCLCKECKVLRWAFRRFKGAANALKLEANKRG